ncbi:phage GP46 family protein [Acinetobacter soli]|uniref:phage GP46 family protein n=1 Tax=Acinetobacter soli TaxID=487316 RepID=UPI000B4D0307|nr:phage GP46 family protein [Acinetobacter soli]
MADIKTVWNTETGSGDYAVADGSLSSGSDVVTAILISLFTDRIADLNDILPDASTTNRNDRRGWWGDTGQQYPIGSRLYLLDRSKAPRFVERDAINYASEALQWMLDDEVVAKFDITANFVKPNQLRMMVVAYRQDGAVISKIIEELW